MWTPSFWLSFLPSKNPRKTSSSRAANRSWYMSSKLWDFGLECLRNYSSNTFREWILFGMQECLIHSRSFHTNEHRNTLTKRSSCLPSNVDAYLTSDKICGMAQEGSPLKIERLSKFFRGNLFGYLGTSLVSRERYIPCNIQEAILHYVLWKLNKKWDICTSSQWSRQGEL
jgi:hypothetical protein